MVMYSTYFNWDSLVPPATYDYHIHARIGRGMVGHYLRHIESFLFFSACCSRLLSSRHLKEAPASFHTSIYSLLAGKLVDYVASRWRKKEEKKGTSISWSQQGQQLKTQSTGGPRDIQKPSAERRKKKKETRGNYP